MKKIVIDCRMINMSGIGTYLKNIIPGLVLSMKYEIVCLGYEEIRSFKWFDKITFINVTSKILSLGEQLIFPFKIPECDIYWSPNWTMPVIFPIRANKIIVTIHDVYHLANRDKFSSLQIKLMEFYLSRVAAISNNVITVSEFSKSEIEKYTKIEKKKISVIHLAVEDDFNEGYVKIAGLTQNILFVGNVKPHKNLKLSLEAFSLIENTEVLFYIVGRREGFITGDDELSELINRLAERVIFTGHVSDKELKGYYANASLFLFPSLYEGFGLPILEAMKFGLPIMASEKASIPEVASDLVMYFDANDKYDLTENLNKFFRKELVCDVTKYPEHLKSFSWEKTISEHIDIIDKNL